MEIDEITDDWIACPSCDRLFDLSHLKHGDKARCPDCNHLMSTHHNDAFTRMQAYAVCALICLVIACTHPFLSFKSGGLESIMTLPSAIEQLYKEGMWDLALLVASFIIIIPALILLLLLSLGAALSHGWRAHWPKDIGKLIFHLKSWSMVEVFLIGVIVSLIKIAHMATVVIGASFWAYAAFTIFFTLALSSLDTHRTWKRIEELQP